MVPTRRRSRDRRGRGLRGPLAPRQLPVTRSRAEVFDELVLDAVEELEPRWGEQLAQLQFAVEAVPPDEEPGADGDVVALSRLEPAGTGRGGRDRPARIVFYRHPLQARGRDPQDLAELVLDVLIHELARHLNTTPEVIDPEGHPPEG